MRSAPRRHLAASLLAAGAAALACLPQAARAAVPAATPPMGWNSYDAYGTTVTEAQFRALPPGRYAIRDLWQHRDQGIAAALTVPLEGHGTALYRLQPR